MQQQRLSTQRGFLLVVAVILIMVVGVVGTLIAYNASSAARLSADQLKGMQTFYNAESGLEIATRYLNRPGIIATPSRIACGSVTGYGELTNASLGGGTFTAITVNSSPVFATTTLNGAITASATTLVLSNASGFAPTGSITIDNEVINYAAVSGNSLIGVARGVAGTMALSHANGAGVGQYQCTLNVKAGIPSIASPTYRRELQRNVHLQYGWAVAAKSGSNFTLLDWNRSSELNWTAVSLAGGSSAASLNAISMLSEADGWAVGDEVGTLTLLRWNGSSWTRNSLARACNNQHLEGVSMASSIEGYAVGVRCGSGSNRRYTFARWNGSAWSLLSPSSSPSIPADGSSNQNLNAVHVVDTSGNGYANLGFAVGNSGHILRYNGTNWVAYTSPVSSNLNGVYVVSAQEAWAVGNSGVILRWNGSSWSAYSSPVSSTLRAIAMYDTNGDGIADFGVVAGNSSKVLVYNGSTWSEVDMGSATIYGVDLYNENDAWVGGTNGAMFHWDGSTWTSFSSGTSQTVNAIGLVHAGNKVTSIWREIFR